MPTLDLERLGLIDLSDEQEALMQTVGGGREAGVKYFFSSIVGSPSFDLNGSIIENQPIPPGGTGVALLDQSERVSGWLQQEPGGDYRGEYAGSLATAPSLDFNSNDNRVAVNRSVPV